jgi:hypothetical protein
LFCKGKRGYGGLGGFPGVSLRKSKPEAANDGHGIFGGFKLSSKLLLSIMTEGDSATILCEDQNIKTLLLKDFDQHSSIWPTKFLKIAVYKHNFQRTTNKCENLIVETKCTIYDFEISFDVAPALTME